MGNRCQSCGKFVGVKVGKPELNSLEIDEETGEIYGQVRVPVLCTECGGELSYKDFEINEICEDAAKHMTEGQDQEHELSIEEGAIESPEELGGTDRKGKPITSYRYMKKFYGYSLSVTVSCSCGFEAQVEISDKEQASYFNEA